MRVNDPWTDDKPVPVAFWGFEKILNQLLLLGTRDIETQCSTTTWIPVEEYEKLCDQHENGGIIDYGSGTGHKGGISHGDENIHISSPVTGCFAVKSNDESLSCFENRSHLKRSREKTEATALSAASTALNGRIVVQLEPLSRNSFHTNYSNGESYNYESCNDSHHHNTKRARLLHPDAQNIVSGGNQNNTRKHTASVLYNRSLWQAPFEWDETVTLANTEIFGNTVFKPLQVRFYNEFSAEINFSKCNCWRLYDSVVQREVINAVLSSKDVFVVMPTGGGKSLCYQLPAVITPAVTVVVMPLLSLMQDQFEQMAALGIQSRCLLGGDGVEQKQAYRDLLDASVDVKLLFVTPEKLSNSPALMGTLGRLKAQGRLSRFIIDEAHCVSQWGNDFRSDYLKLKNLRATSLPKRIFFREHCKCPFVAFEDVPLVCLTATATDEIINDVAIQLCLKNFELFQMSFDRPNLKFSVLYKSKTTLSKDIAFLIQKSFPRKCGIVYCLSRRDCDIIAADLNSEGISASVYHSTAEGRQDTQKRWMNDEISVIVATVAFGMGINKRDVRFVIHSSMAKSIENYYQEAGRAGRDGKPADAILFYDFHDKLRLESLEDGRNTARSNRHNVIDIVRYCEDVQRCRRQMLLHHFGENTALPCANEQLRCDNCTRSPSSIQKVQCDEAVKSVLAAIYEAKAIVGSYSRAITMASLRDILAGVRSNKKHQFSQIRSFGALKHWKPPLIYKLLRWLCANRVIKENCVRLSSQSCVGVVVLSSTSPPLPTTLHFLPEELASRNKRLGVSSHARNQPKAAAKSEGRSARSPEVNGFDESYLSLSEISDYDGALEQGSHYAKPWSPYDCESCSRERGGDRQMLSELTPKKKRILKKNLIELRSQLAAERNLATVTHVFSAEGLRQLVTVLPTTLDELKSARITSLTALSKIRLFGAQIVNCVNRFRKDHLDVVSIH